MKLTNSQNLIIQGLLSILVAAILTALAAGVQFVASHGLDVPTLISLMLTAFGASFGLALKNYVPQNAANELQAYKDLTTQLQQALHIQQTTPPTVNVQVPQQTQQQVPLQGLTRAIQQQSALAPQQSFPVAPQYPATNPPQGGSAIAPIPMSQDTTPRVAALLSQFGQGQQGQ